MNDNDNNRLSKEEYDDKETRNRRSWTAYVFAFLSSILNAFGSYFFKITAENKMEVVLIRSLLQYLMLMPFMTWKKIDLYIPDVKVTSLLLFRGVLGPFVMLLIGLSLEYLPLADQASIFYTNPILVALLARLFLKEKFGIINILLTLVAFAGFILVAQPSFIFGEAHDDAESLHGASRAIGIVIAFAAALGHATIAIVLRKLGREVHFSQSMLFVAWEGTAIAIVYLLIAGVEMLPCYQSLPTLIACVFCLILSQICRTVALQREKAAPISLIQTSQVIFAFILQYIFLGVIPNLYCVVGASLIMISCIVLSTRNIVKAVKAKE